MAKNVIAAEIKDKLDIIVFANSASWIESRKCGTSSITEHSTLVFRHRKIPHGLPTAMLPQLMGDHVSWEDLNSWFSK